MGRTRTPATDLALTIDFLSLPHRDRLARLIGPPTLPRPTRAFLNTGVLIWIWSRQSLSLKQLRKKGETAHGFDLENARMDEKGAGSNSPKLQKLRPDLCLRFAQLDRGSDEQIRAFAERWGPLGLDARAEETVEDWRHYAALAAALLRFTAERASGGKGGDEDWLVLCEATPLGMIDRSQLNTQQQTAITALAVNTLFSEARSHRILDLLDGHLQIRPAASHLFGVLITQIAHMMARTDQLAICAGCKNAFTPKRALSRGSRRYCSRCRTAKVPQRDASRDWRRRTV
jgi:hypothetical protein